MSRCGAEAHLIAEGRVVGMLRCDMPAGHDNPELVAPTRHEARIHWEDGEVIAEDDGEPGVEVPFDDPADVAAYERGDEAHFGKR